MMRSNFPVAVMRFYAIVPDVGFVQTTSIHMSTDHIKDMIRVMCRSLNYFPTKEEASAGSQAASQVVVAS